MSTLRVLLIALLADMLVSDAGLMLEDARLLADGIVSQFWKPA